eukprot:4411489-Alexandrium_andersonii.AAC.1
MQQQTYGRQHLAAGSFLRCLSGGATDPLDPPQPARPACRLSGGGATAPWIAPISASSTPEALVRG